MAWPFVAAAAIGAGASLESGRLQRREGRAHQDREAALQREFAQHGIQWRVEDAKAAGLHPLYALGGAGATYTPSPMVLDDSIGRAGQEVSRAMLASQDHKVRMRQAEVAEKMAEAQMEKDFAQASYYRSLAGRTAQGAQVGFQSDPSVYANPNVSLGSVTPAADMVKVSPSEVTSYAGNERQTAAGRDVFWKKFVIDSRTGREWSGGVAGSKPVVMYLPNAKDAGEAMEAVSESYAMLIAAINYNMNKNPEFMNEARDVFPFFGLAYDTSDAIWRLRHMQRSRRAVPAPNRLK